MRIVKPYGASKTGCSGEGEIVRRIHPNSFRQDAADVEMFALSHYNLVLAQWISLIDKVITKPSDGGTPSRHQLDLRQRVGAAAWTIIVSRDLLATAPNRMKRLEREWWAKIHPYGRETEPTGILDFRGRWFAAFSSEPDPSKIDCEALAHSLYSHLYEAERRIGGGLKSRSKGLVRARAASIANNVLKDSDRPLSLTPPWSARELGDYCTKSNIIETIGQLVEKYKGQRAARTRSAVGRAFYEHFGKLFVDREGRTLSVSEARASHPGLFALHAAVKRRIRPILNAPQRYWLKKLPGSAEELGSDLAEEWRNRAVSDLIRLGKVIHYQATPQGDENTPAHIFRNWTHDVSASRFWSSDSQTEIKQHEAFVRIWRHVLSFAGWSATNWADPEALIDRDILSARQRETAIQNLSPDAFDRQAQLLFGRAARNFTSGDRASRQDILDLALTGLSALRNAAFHFGGLAPFLDALRSLGHGKKESTLAAVRQLYSDDARALSQRLAADLRSVDAEHCLTQWQMDTVIAALDGLQKRFDDLPNFQNVLHRGQAAYFWRKVDMRLPAALSLSSPGDVVAQCRHLILKRLYRGPFPEWLCELSSDKLREFVDGYITRSTNEARRIAGDDRLTARASGRIKVLDEDTVFDLFAMLRKGSLSELREAGKPNAAERDLAKYLRNLELDVVAQAFQAFIEARSLDWLFEIKERDRSPERKSNVPPITNEEKTPDDWQCVLYFLLHLVSVDEINKLSHQVSRSSIRDAAQLHMASELLGTLALYERNHDAKYVSFEGSQDYGKLTALFASEAIADSVMGDLSPSAAAGQRSVRALREMLRFQPPAAVIGLLGQIPIERGDIETAQSLSVEVAEAQDTRSKLHKKWVANDKKLSEEDIEDYRSCLSLIVRHRDASHQALILNHSATFRLVVAALAKLLDYSGMWERDLYFVTLAVIHKVGDTPSTIFASARSQRLIGRGQIIEAIRERASNATSDRLVDVIKVLLGVNFRDKGDACIKIRNELAHFEFLRQDAPLERITDLVNDTKYLVSYDRKRANRVSSSIRDIFAQFGVDLSWRSSGGKLCDPSVEARQICHLQREDLPEPLVAPKFVRMVETFV